MAPLNKLPSTISAKTWGWKIKANTTANKVDKHSVTTGGKRLAIITPVTTGTMSNQGVMVKREERAVVNWLISWLLLLAVQKPAIKKMTSEMANEGMVVISI